MIDLLAAQLALRNRALGVTVATTGSAALAATATGFTRSVGSFIADGFAIGMEIVSSGFSTGANNGTGVITAVTVGVLTVSMFVITITGGVQSSTRPATVVEAETAGRTIAARLPAMRAFENFVPSGLTAFTPVPGIPYLEEDFVPATHTLHGNATGGVADETGLYVLKWYGLSGTGVFALRKSIDALKKLFTPGTKLTAGADAVQMRGEENGSAPQTSQIIPLAGGWSCLTLTIPWRGYSVNAVAA